MPQLLIMGVLVLGAWLLYRRFVAEATRLAEKSRRAKKEQQTGAIGTLVKDPVNPTRSFQGLLLTLQRFWAERGCVVQPYDMEVGAGTFHPGDDAARARAEALEGRLCAALAPAQGRPLWREPEPAAALLPVPGDPEAEPAEPAGTLSQSLKAIGIDRCCTTSASSRTIGKARRWAPGASAGNAGATAWKSASSPISSRSRHRMRAGFGRTDLWPRAPRLYVQGVDSVYDLNFNGREGDDKVTYGDVFLQAEQEYSRHNFEHADTAMLFEQFRGRGRGAAAPAARKGRQARTNI
jgi:glycyl-tRNA synthetase alpha chain